MAADNEDTSYIPKIRELPVHERPRERLVRLGSGALSTEGCWSTLGRELNAARRYRLTDDALLRAVRPVP